LGKGQLLGISGASLFLLSLAFFFFNPAYAHPSQEDPPLNPANEGLQPNYSTIVNPGCADGDTLPPNSSVGDGLCNSWETATGLRISTGGVTYKYLCGAYGPDTICPSTSRRDIYVEYDWLIDHAPSTTAISNVVSAFNTAGINLHVQADQNTNKHWMQVQPVTMEGVPNPNTEFNQIKRFFFGTSADKLNSNYLTAKRQAFHYTLFGHQLENPNTSLSGMAEISGNDIFIAMASFGTPTIDQTAGTFMHELGHNLGLAHGGPETLSEATIDCKPNSVSVMSSSRMTPDLFASIGMSSGWELNYSGIASTINEDAGLTESNLLGLQGNTLIHGNNGNPMWASVPFSPNPPVGIDWDDSNTIAGAPRMDANYIPAVGCNTQSFNTYTAHNEWGNLNFKFKDEADFGDGVAVGKFKDTLANYQKGFEKGKPGDSKYNAYFRETPFKTILGNLEITKSPRAQEKAGIIPDDIICEHSHEFIYVNRTENSDGTPICIKTEHFADFLERFKDFVFFDQYLCDINYSIEKGKAEATDIDSYTNSKTGQPLNCSEYVKQYE